MKHIIIKKYLENNYSMLELTDINTKLEPLLYELFTIIDSKLYTYIINFIINIELTNIETIIKSMIYYINNKDIDKFKDCFNSIYYNEIDNYY